MKFTVSHMNSALVETWHLLQQQSEYVVIDELKEMKLLYLDPPDHNTNAQGCLSALQTPLGMKSEEIENMSRASMGPGEVEAIRTTDPMVILRENEISSRDLPIRASAYDTVQQRKIIPIKEMKASEM